MKRRKGLQRVVDEPHYHRLTLGQLAATFATSLTHGLDDTKACKLRIKRGPNKLTTA